MSLPWRGPAPGAPSCRCRPTSCRSAATATGASAGATWGRSATSCCCARPASRSGRSARPSGRSGTATSGRLWERTATLLPGARGEVWTEGREGDGLVHHSADEGSVVRIEAQHPEAGEVRAFLRFGAGEVGRGRLPDRRGRVRLDAKARRRARRVRRPDRRAPLAGRGARASRTSRRATTRTTRSGAGRPASARQPTGARSAGTSSAASTIRQSAPSARSGSTASRPSPGRSSFDGLEAIALRRRLPPRLRRRVRATAGGEPLRRPLHVPPAVRRFLAGPCRAGSSSTSGLGVMEHHDAHW